MWFFKPNVERLMKKGNIKGLIKALHYQKNYGVCSAAAEALVKIGAPAVELLRAYLETNHLNNCHFFTPVGCVLRTLLAAWGKGKVRRTHPTALVVNFSARRDFV